MAEPPAAIPDMQYLLSDLNTRIRDAEERNKITKERTLLLGKNLIDSKEAIGKELQELKRKSQTTEVELEKIKKITNALIQETGKYVKREEIILVERMLKDFQPLEFARMKDIDEMLDEKLKLKKQIKTSKP